MAKGISFEIGQCYFLVGYHDRNFKLPFIDSYTFIGRGDRAPSAGDFWYFQNAQSFSERGQLSPCDVADEATLGDRPRLILQAEGFSVNCFMY